MEHQHTIDRHHAEDAARNFHRWLQPVQYEDWRFNVCLDDIRPYLQISADAVCSNSGKMHTWKSRKWFLSPHMTRSEVVQTAFKAVMTAVEHEARELFRYKGYAIYSPHYNVERLVALHQSGDAKEIREARDADATDE